LYITFLVLFTYKIVFISNNYKGSLGKAEDHVLKIEKEYGKENCIDRSEIPPIIFMTTSPATR
jgi:hypothetical protein